MLIIEGKTYLGRPCPRTECEFIILESLGSSGGRIDGEGFSD